MPKNTIKATGLHKDYRIDGRSIEVLKGVNLSISAGETVAVIGPSGAGKSTLLHLLGLLEKPSSGSILLEQQETSTLNDRQRTSLRLNSIGFVFQFHHLLPEFTALENVMMPGLIYKIEKKECQERAFSLLEKVQLKERIDHKPGELSGGEQQRVALARALMNNPVLILADEPTGNLDRKASANLREILWDICREKDSSLLIVTHNEQLAREADRVLEMSDGRFSQMPATAL